MLRSILPGQVYCTDPHVVISQGEVTGRTTHLTSGVDIDVFRGIPYAKPPIGPLRLKPPQAPEPWTGIKNATTSNVKCIQGGYPWKLQPGESEDCLYLDVYTPRFNKAPNSSNNMSVMVWIHGGSFIHGHKNAFNGTLLAAKGVIVVTINYRLGTLGWFSTGDDVIPGNFALMDMIQALTWIQTNIGKFGGDPKSVTVFGESAGGMSVSLLVISPLAKGLSARAIMESGVSYMGLVAPQKFVKSTKDIAILTGNLLGCNQSISPDFLKCLQSQTVSKFYLKSTNAINQLKLHYGVTVETTLGSMPDYPRILLARGAFNHVDTLRGFNSGESGIADKGNDGLTTAEFIDCIKSRFPTSALGDAYIQRVQDAYIGNITDPFAIRSQCLQFKSDWTFILPTVREAQVTSKYRHGAKMYLYEFNYRASYAKTPEWKGATHTSEVDFV